MVDHDVYPWNYYDPWEVTSFEKRIIYRPNKTKYGKRVLNRRKRRPIFPNVEWWSANTAIARFALSKLYKLKQYQSGYPGGLEKDEWNIILNKILWALTFEIEDMVCESEQTPFEKRMIKKSLNNSKLSYSEGLKKANEGYLLFGEYFASFWD